MAAFEVFTEAFRIRTLAEQDLEDTTAYLAEEAEPAVAIRFADAVIDAITMLRENPDIGAPRPMKSLALPDCGFGPSLASNAG